MRLVFFMEEAPQELKSIVDFLNRQTERTEVLIVETRYYTSEGRRFVVPSLFGYTEEARRAKRTVNVAAGGKRQRWTEEAFMADATQNLTEDQVNTLREILGAARQDGLEVRWGTGSQRGSFSLVVPEVCGRSFASFLSDGKLWINLAWLNGSPEAERFRERVAVTVKDEVGLEAKGGGTDYWTYNITEWHLRAKAMIDWVRMIGSEG